MPRGMTLEEERWLVNSHTCANEMVGDTCRVCFLANKLAEVERERDDEIKAARSRWFALAAEQADNARLREALDRLRDLAEIGLPMKANLVYTITNAALAQSPSSNAALRQVCAQMGTEAVTAYIGGASEKAAVDKALEGVLGPEVAR